MGKGIFDSLDLFRYSPKKYIQSTWCGALITFGVISVISYLVTKEVNLFLNKELETEILFDDLKIQDIEINLDIEILHTPCELLEVFFTSTKGKRHNLARHFPSKTKEGKIKYSPYIAGTRAYPNILKAYKEREGCKISGTFYVHLIRQRFKLTFRNPEIIRKLNADVEGGVIMDLSHRINDLRVGENSNYFGKDTLDNYNLKGIRTLNNHSFIEDRKDEYHSPYMHTYYITAVPNLVDRAILGSYRFFQYVASHYSERHQEGGYINFLIHIDPRTMHSYYKSPNTLSFIMKLFSYIGGIYMIAKMLDNYFSLCSKPKSEDDSEDLGGLTKGKEETEPIDSQRKTFKESELM